MIGRRPYYPSRGINAEASVSLHSLEGTVVSASIERYRPRQGDTGMDFLRDVLSVAGITPWFTNHPTLGEQLVDLHGLNRPTPYGYTMLVQTGHGEWGMEPLQESISSIPASQIRSISILEQEYDPGMGPEYGGEEE